MLNKHFIFLLLFSTSLLLGQEVTFQAKASKTEVAVNERFSVQFVLTVSQNNFKVDQQMKLPDFGGLHQIAESQQSSMQIVNGEVYNQSGLEIVLLADKEGEFTISSAFIVIDGKRYKTDPIKINVKKGSKSKANSDQRIQNTFLKTEISNETPFVNEEAVLVVKVYTKDYGVLNRLRNFKEPDFSNLVAKYVNERVEEVRRQEFVNGQTYISQEIARYVVFPQKSGEIEINPFSLDVLISGYYGAEVVSIFSEPISITAKDLPKGQPANFSGAVGDFRMNTHLSKQETEASQAVNFEIEIIGSGNLNMFKMPKVIFSEHIETYSPKRRDNFATRPSGIRGKIIENYLLVPQFGGNYNIGPIKFSFFNPEEQRYITLTSEPINLVVDGPKPPKEKPQTEDLNTADIHKIDSTESSDESLILPLNLNVVKDKVVSSVSHKHTWIWVVVGFIVLTFLFVLLRKKSSAKSSQISAKQENELFKSKMISKLVELKSFSNSGDTSGFYSLQETILTDLAMHYTETSLANFTENSIAEKITLKYNTDLAQRWKILLLESKQAKYSPVFTQENLAQKMQEIETITLEFFSHK